MFLAAIDRDAAGRLQNIGDVPLYFANGYPLTGTGQLCLNTVGPITSWLKGLPFAEDLIAITTTGSPATYLNGVPLSTAGRMVCEKADPVRYSNGWPLTSSGALAIA